MTQELSAAFGLGGRARKAVSGRINESIGRLRKDHASLALHLENALRLGTFCEYRPDKAIPWQL